MRLIDYTPGGASYNPAAVNDIGAADEIHGDNGDDFIYGQVGNVSLGPGHDGLRATWFVGYRGDVAFAVLRLTHSSSASAAPVARQFLQNLPAGSSPRHYVDFSNTKQPCRCTVASY